MWYFLKENFLYRIGKIKSLKLKRWLTFSSASSQKALIRLYSKLKVTRIKFGKSYFANIFTNSEYNERMLLPSVHAQKPWRMLFLSQRKSWRISWWHNVLLSTARLYFCRHRKSLQFKRLRKSNLQRDTYWERILLSKENVLHRQKWVASTMTIQIIN